MRLTYQRVTGSIMANSHPGSYCGQDAYNDMFVTERKDVEMRRQRTVASGASSGLCRDTELHARSTDGSWGGHKLTEEMYVRRLTPEECELLQGYPMGWSNIGEWTDTKGKVHKGSSDSSRYKALGNSICTPFWFWLLRRISAQYERPALLGSLFDGIGGFPYCWEMCNGPGTAIWASEIEEFPIAVTKYHFPERTNND